MSSVHFVLFTAAHFTLVAVSISHFLTVDIKFSCFSSTEIRLLCFFTSACFSYFSVINVRGSN